MSTVMWPPSAVATERFRANVPVSEYDVERKPASPKLGSSVPGCAVVKAALITSVNAASFLMVSLLWFVVDPSQVLVSVLQEASRNATTCTFYLEYVRPAAQRTEVDGAWGRQVALEAQHASAADIEHEHGP